MTISEDQFVELTETTLDHVMGLAQGNPLLAASILTDAAACLCIAANLDGGIMIARLDAALQAASDAITDFRDV